MITSLRRILVAAAVGGLALGAMAASAGAGELKEAAPLTIVKTVSGPVPEGTTFTAELFCLSPIIIDGESGTDTATVTFDATGQPTSADTFYFGDPGECTVTETADGGAATTTYACDGVLPTEPTAASAGSRPTSVARPCPRTRSAPRPARRPTRSRSTSSNRTRAPR